MEVEKAKSSGDVGGVDLSKAAYCLFGPSWQNVSPTITTTTQIEYFSDPFQNPSPVPQPVITSLAYTAVDGNLNPSQPCDLWQLLARSITDAVHLRTQSELSRFVDCSSPLPSCDALQILSWKLAPDDLAYGAFERPSTKSSPFPDFNHPIFSAREYHILTIQNGGTPHNFRSVPTSQSYSIVDIWRPCRRGIR